MKAAVKVENINHSEMKRFLRFILINTIVCIVAYIVLISNQLTNTYDGMWHGSYYTDYSWVISIGRWFWPLLGRLRLHLSPEPFTSVLSLILYVCGGCIVACWFGLKDSLKGYLVVLVSVINTVVCACLSYRYMSPTFAFSYLLSIVSAWIIRIPNWKRCIASICFLTISLACYQAYIGCACVLILLWILKAIIDQKERYEIFRFCAAAAAVILVSCAFYKIIWDVVLSVQHIEASSYKGANNLSINQMLTHLPQTIKTTYVSFLHYFTSVKIKHNAYQPTWLYRIAIVLFAVMVIVNVAKGTRQNKPRMIIAFVLLATLPVMANVAMILSVDNGSQMIQMVMPMEICVPFLLCLDDEARDKERRGFILGKASTLLVALLFIGNFMMVSVDQHVMLTGRNSSVALMNGVASGLKCDLNPQDGFVFVGKPSDNPLFFKDTPWYLANDYAQYGDFWTDTDCGAQSYYGLLRDSGINLKFNFDAYEWQRLEALEEVQNMPIYPNEGYYAQVGDSVVVKISN